MARIKLIHHINVQVSDRARTREWCEKGARRGIPRLRHLDALGIAHVRTSAASTMPNIGGTDPQQGRREDTDEHYTYIHDPDGPNRHRRTRLADLITLITWGAAGAPQAPQASAPPAQPPSRSSAQIR